MKVDEKKAMEYIKKIKAPVCPLCGEKEWNFGDKVYQLMEFDFDGLHLGKSTIPVVPIVCENCGNTYFVNALVAGLIDKPTLDTEQNNKKE